MDLSVRVSNLVKMYLNQLIIKQKYPLSNYRIESNRVTDNSINVSLEVNRGFLGLFFSGRTLVNDIMENEVNFKSALDSFLHKEMPTYDFYIDDLATVSNYRATFKVEYYPSVRIPPDMLRKIFSYLHPSEVERITSGIPGQENYLSDPYIWYMFVTNSYPMFKDYPLQGINWIQLYHELDTLNKEGIPIIFDTNLLNIAIIRGLDQLVKILLTYPGVDPSSFDNQSIVNAVSYGHTDILRLLLQDTRVDPTVRNNIVIKTAVMNLEPEVVQILLQDPRIDPLEDFPNILNTALTLRNLYGDRVTPEITMKTKDTFLVLRSDPRILQAINQMPINQRTRLLNAINAL